MLFQLKLTDMLRADLAERAKSGAGQVTGRHSNQPGWVPRRSADQIG